MTWVMRVLVAEDEKTLADLVAEGLRRYAMAVDVAYDGTAAAERLSVNDYDVLVLDRDPGGHFAARPDYVDTWPPHCVAGTPGAAFHPAFDMAKVEEVFSKGAHAAAYSGFEGSSADGAGLAGWLRDRGVEAVDVVGIATDHCVRATALDAAGHGFAVRVLLDLTAGVAKETTDAALVQLAGAGVELAGSPVVRS